MPPDVATYALSKSVAGGARRPELVTFQVTRWNPENGVTVVRRFDAGPGEIVGDLATTRVPVSDGSGAKNQKIDFNSREIVLDVTGGTVPLPQPVAIGAPLAMP